MSTKGKRFTAIFMIFCLFFGSIFGINKVREVRVAKEAEFASRYVLWQARNPKVENSIKGYIDDIDWGFYISEFVKALADPENSAKELYKEIGVK